MSNMDHPRVCREKLPYLPSGFRGWGSPPRVRGQAPINRHQAEDHGVTPACAGKSAGTGSRSGASWDHPRVCGEKGAQDFCCCVHAGSPPRMRGKDFTWSFASVKLRITPACAGKRPEKPHSVCITQDHPRVCGEKDKAAEKAQHLRGSPPRVRGKGRSKRFRCTSPWITPARAGKSYTAFVRLHPLRDHPRACGEKDEVWQQLDELVGSPPRVQGKAVSVSPPHYNRGITPAYAGKSSIQHLTASLGEFKVQKGHPVPHLRQRLQVWPDHARHLRHGLILHASRSAGQGRRLCPGPCPDTAGSGTPRGPSPAKRPHTSPPAATPGGCRPWQSGATAPGSR